jgi:tRNA splicing endonuclease
MSWHDKMMDAFIKGAGKTTGMVLILSLVGGTYMLVSMSSKEMNKKSKGTETEIIMEKISEKDNKDDDKKYKKLLEKL